MSLQQLRHPWGCLSERGWDPLELLPDGCAVGAVVGAGAPGVGATVAPGVGAAVTGAVVFVLFVSA